MTKLTNEQILKEFSIDNCRVCIDVNEWKRKAQQLSMSEISNHTEKPQNLPATVGANIAASLVTTDKVNENLECPPDILVLGRSTWTFLHSMAAYYPDEPSVSEQSDMQQFIKLFSKFYPCSPCAEQFRVTMDIDPPLTNSRSNLAKWFCRMHNEVNERQGKPIFDCAKVDERWRDGPSDGSCH